MSRDSRKYEFGAVSVFVLIHLSVFTVFFVRFTPWLLLWTTATYAIRMFGVTAGYHRYFSHRSYKLGRAAQFCMAALAQSSGQKGVHWWAAHHRWHHRYSDAEPDVHSPGCLVSGGRTWGGSCLTSMTATTKDKLQISRSSPNCAGWTATTGFRR